MLHHYIWLQRTQLWWSPWHLAVTNLKVMKHGLSPVPSNSFWLKLIKFELSLINIRYSVYRWYIPSSVSEKESQVLLFEELGMSVSPTSSPWTARSLSASDELPLTLSFFRVRLSRCKETHKYRLKHLDYCFTRHSAYISNRNPTNWNVTWLYSSLFLITEFMKMELQTCVWSCPLRILRLLSFKTSNTCCLMPSLLNPAGSKLQVSSSVDTKFSSSCVAAGSLLKTGRSFPGHFSNAALVTAFLLKINQQKW